MLRQPYQFRYYGDKNKNNFPSNIDEKKLVNGTFLENKYSHILQIGIQGKPGIQFSLNESSWIEIPDTGIYELDVSDFGIIHSIRFNPQSSGWIKSSNDNKNFFILIDILYQEEVI